MKIQDVASAAQSLANYLYREGERAKLDTVAGALKVMRDQVTVLQQDRISAMVDAAVEERVLGEV